jgi:hypothetical protein
VLAGHLQCFDAVICSQNVVFFQQLDIETAIEFVVLDNQNFFHGLTFHPRGCIRLSSWPWIKIKGSVKGKRLPYHICGVAKVSGPYPWFALSLWPGSNCLARHAVQHGQGYFAQGLVDLPGVSSRAGERNRHALVTAARL